MAVLIRLVPRWWGKKKDEERIIRRFVPEGSRMGKDGLYPQKYTLGEIRQKYQEVYSRELNGLRLVWWLLRSHKVSYYAFYRFHRVSELRGEDTLFGISVWIDAY